MKRVWCILGGIGLLLVVGGIVDSRRNQRMPGRWLRSDRQPAPPGTSGSQAAPATPAVSLESLPPDARGRRPNRLIHEKSPYLLQHAYNPVDWYPWGPEAFAKAKGSLRNNWHK